MGFFSKIFNFFRPVVSNLQRGSLLMSVLIGKRLEKIEDFPTRKESPVIREFLESPLGSRSDLKAKKALAAATVIARKRGIPEAVKVKSPMELASAVDDGLSRMKVAYKVGKGLLDSTKASDEIIDRAAARVATFTDAVIDYGTGVVLDKVVKAAACVFPPVAVVAPIVKLAAPFIAKPVKKIVRKGIEVVAKAAKTVVKSVVSGVKKIGEKISKYLSVFLDN